MNFDPFRDPFRSLDRLASQLASGTRTPMGVPMDVWREGDAFHVAIDLPGVDPSAVEVHAERNTLTVRADRRSTIPSEAQVLVAERPQGGFTRQLALGDGLDADNITAEAENGVLHLVIPVASTTQPRRIQVSGSGGQSGPTVVEGQTGGASGGSAGDPGTAG
jgi:HSP20 family protein